MIEVALDRDSSVSPKPWVTLTFTDKDNGDKLDNRIENLELWTRSQPAGQRVEDKIAWARDFLIQYGFEVSGG